MNATKPWIGIFFILALAAAVGCRERGTHLPPPPAAEKMTARQALEAARPKALAWDSGAFLIRILSGRELDDRGGADFWEFTFAEPSRRMMYLVKVKNRVVTAAAAGSLEGKAVPIPADFLDSRTAFRRSTTEFAARHYDHASLTPGWLACNSDFHPTPAWVMLYEQEDHLPRGSLVDAVTGAYVGEVER